MCDAWVALCLVVPSLALGYVVGHVRCAINERNWLREELRRLEEQDKP